MNNQKRKILIQNIQLLFFYCVCFLLILTSCENEKDTKSTAIPSGADTSDLRGKDSEKSIEEDNYAVNSFDEIEVGVKRETVYYQTWKSYIIKNETMTNVNLITTLWKCEFFDNLVKITWAFKEKKLEFIGYYKKNKSSTVVLRKLNGNKYCDLKIGRSEFQMIFDNGEIWYHDVQMNWNEKEPTPSEQFSEDVQFEENSDGENSIENVYIQCVPFDDGIDPRILSMPDPNALHPEWKGAGFVGSSYTFVAKKRIINTKGVFFYGDLFSPRGGLMGGGPYYVICSEWDYSGEFGLTD